MPPATPSQAAPPAGSEPFQPVAALLAVAFPGLGHFYLGQVHRGILVTAGVLGLYLTGLLIGGIACVDRRDNYIWFLGQALVGPMTLGLDYVHQQHLKVIGPDARTGVEKLREPYPNEARDPATGRAVSIVAINGVPTAKTADGTVISPAYPSYVKAVPRSNELGTLFTTVAGFLNVMVVIDAAFGARVQRKRKPIEGATRTLRAPTIGGGA
jgi:TM2 domain-containing membrane protein YozV